MRSSTRKAVAVVALLFGSATWAAATVQESKLSNGAPFLAAVDAGPPRQIVTLVYETGCRVLPKGHSGAASLLEYLLLEGPKGKTNAEYRRELFLLNADINASIAGRVFYLIVSAPPQTLKAALSMSNQLLQQPKLTQDQLQQARQKSISRRRAQEQDMRFLMDLAAQRALYPGHPDAYSCISRVSDIERLGLDELTADWQALTQPSRLIFGTAGPMPPGEVRALLETTLVTGLATGLVKGSKVLYERAGPVLPASFPKPSSAGGTDVILVEQPGAQDNQMMYLWPHSVKPDTPEFATAEIAMTLLGGGFTGRLQQELREKRGLTYGAFADISDSLPQYIAASFAGADNIGRLIEELPQVYQSFITEELTEERLGIAKETLVTSFRDGTELPLDAFLESLNSRFYGRDPNAWRGRAERWTAVSATQLKQFIKERMNTKPAYLVVVGDPQVLRPALEKAGYSKESIKTLAVGEL